MVVLKCGPCLCADFECGQLLRCLVGLQRRDHITQIAFHDAQQLVQREVDAVVGEPPLREVVGADAVAAVAGADQAFALGGVFGGALAAVFFLDARGQYAQCLRFVAVLAASVLAFGDDAGGQMGDAHRRVGFVDVRPPAPLAR